MKTTKLASFTLKLDTIERLNEYAKKHSTNKSGFVDRIINQEIDRRENFDLSSLLDGYSGLSKTNIAMLLSSENSCIINEAKESDEEK